MKKKLCQSCTSLGNGCAGISSDSYFTFCALKKEKYYICSRCDAKLSSEQMKCHKCGTIFD